MTQQNNTDELREKIIRLLRAGFDPLMNALSDVDEAYDALVDALADCIIMESDTYTKKVTENNLGNPSLVQEPVEQMN
jgi:hypothetical protein